MSAWDSPPSVLKRRLSMLRGYFPRAAWRSGEKLAVHVGVNATQAVHPAARADIRCKARQPESAPPTTTVPRASCDTFIVCSTSRDDWVSSRDEARTAAE